MYTQEVQHTKGKSTCKPSSTVSSSSQTCKVQLFQIVLNHIFDRMIYSLYIINKAGGLIYHLDFPNDHIPKLTSNEYLVLAGTFHG